MDFGLDNSNASAPVQATPVMNNTINISSGSSASSVSGISSSGMGEDNLNGFLWDLPSATKVNPSLYTFGNQGGGMSAINNINVLTSDIHNNHVVNSTSNIHDQVVAILTSAVADARIGIDVH